jgi:hypothetical protein
MSQQQSRFEIIFEAGKRRYEKKTGQRLDATLFASMSTVSDMRSYVEQENDKFATSRAQNVKIYDRLNTAFTPLERVSQIISAGTSAGFPPAGACLGAVALLIKSAQDVSSHYDRILDLFEMLAVSMVL